MTPMRRKDRAILAPEAIHTIIRESSHVVVGMVDNGVSYTVPLNFGFEQNIIYLHCAKQGRKLDILTNAGGQLPVSVLFVGKNDFYDPGKGASGLTTRYTSVMGNGILQEVTEENSRVQALQAILRQVHQEHLPVTAKDLTRTCVLQIRDLTLCGKSNIPEMHASPNA